MCACEWNYTCPKCLGTPQHWPSYELRADFDPEPDRDRVSETEFDGLIAEWRAQ